MSKVCIICNERPLKKGNASWCYPCSKNKERQRWQTIPFWKRQERWLKSRYNKDYKWYVQTWEDQKGLCKICEDPILLVSEHSKQKACVDHNHKTGQVRGLLCNHCNRALGLLKESKETLQRAIDYLNIFEDQNV